MTEALKCPTCSAPLEYPPGGGATMRCPYCQSTVLLTGNPQSIATPNSDIPDSLRPMIEQAMEMAKASGRVGPQSKIEAIKFYRASSGASLADAKKAIESLGSGRPPDFSTSQPNPAAEVVKIAATGAKIAATVGIIIFVGVMLLISFIIHQVRHQVITANAVVTPNITMPTIPDIALATPPAPTFAHMVMQFGSEGVGIGRFKDSRALAMDGQGHIYVGEYSDGRVQAFDSEGKFLSMWSIGKDQSLLALAAGRDGTVYAVVPGHITRYQGSTGMPLGEVETTLPSADDPNVDYESYTDACVAPTGDLYALGQNSDVVDCTPDGKIKSLFKASEKVGESMDPSRLLVVPTGEIFVLDRQKGVFKFASDGRYINRFGAAGEDADPSHPDPSHFLSPENLAADSQGRIYVSDADPAIRVFNPDGAYIDSFGTNDVAFGMVITDKDEIFASFRNQHSIEKFVLDPKK